MVMARLLLAAAAGLATAGDVQMPARQSQYLVACLARVRCDTAQLCARQTWAVQRKQSREVCF